MHLCHTLNLAGEFHHCVFVRAFGLHVFSRAQFGEHLPLDASFLRPQRLRPSWGERLPLRRDLQLDALLLMFAQTLRNGGGHGLTALR